VSRISFHWIASRSASKLASTMLALTPHGRPAAALAVLAVDDDAGHRLGAAIGDADLEIDQLHVVDAGLIGAKILGQRLGQRVDRAAVLAVSSMLSLTDIILRSPILTTTTASDRLIIRSYLFLRRSTVTR
jgi:hypothetical protein